MGLHNAREVEFLGDLRRALGLAESATTYALGHAAKAYYAGGRTLSTDALKTTFQQLLGSAQKLRERYGSEIEQKSRSLDLKQILSVVKGQA